MLQKSLAVKVLQQNYAALAFHYSAKMKKKFYNSSISRLQSFLVQISMKVLWSVLSSFASEVSTMYTFKDNAVE